MDKELLEAAAEAAGIRCVWHEQWKCMSLLGRPQIIGIGGQNKSTWDPINDDGDALRLAVSLQISMTPGEVRCSAEWWRRPDMIDLDSVIELSSGDPHAAIRRAIVRAAAEIQQTVAHKK